MVSQSLTEVFTQRARRSPDEVAIVFIDEQGNEEPITMGQFHQLAQVQARRMRANHIRVGDVILLVIPHSVELIAAFWGAILIGAVPTIYNYKAPNIDTQSYLKRVEETVNQIRARAVLTAPSYADDLKNLLLETDCLVIPVSRWSNEEPANFEQETLATFGDEQIAMIQLSSGSTGMRKAVLISHRAILNYKNSIENYYQLNKSDVMVSWLPLYHDLGLIYCFILPLIIGFKVVLMSPLHWVMEPIILYKAITKYRGTICYMPNFGFRHSVRLLDRKALKGTNLRSLRILGNGGEPVDLESLEKFHQHFSRFGAKRNIYVVGYGLAEHTVGASSTKPGKFPRADWVDRVALHEQGQAKISTSRSPNAKALISCGPPHPGVEIKVVDRNMASLPERFVGSILIRSNYLFSGYHLQPELTAQTLYDGWLITGDLGYLSDGELFICGRQKDLIIIGGSNIYPQDIENIADTLPGIALGRSVAFGIPDEELGTEKIVVVSELRKPLDKGKKEEIRREFRNLVMAKLDVNLSEIHLLDQRGWVIKTSSGKLARSACREKYFQTIAPLPPKR